MYATFVHDEWVSPAGPIHQEMIGETIRRRSVVSGPRAENSSALSGLRRMPFTL
jgi:hypothetical protein